MSVMATGTVDGADEPSLARDMIDVHGPKAAVVAQDNARAAALAGQRPQAKFWIRVLGLIQQRGTDKDGRLPERGRDPRQVQLKDNGNVYFADQQRSQQRVEGSPVEH